MNDALSRLPASFESIFAVGSSGAELLPATGLYALTADGIELLDSENYAGGGGLRSDNGTIPIRRDYVKVGLFYCFSKMRDNSIESAYLLNPAKEGFDFGWYDEEGEFQLLGQTEAARIMLLPGEDCAVSAFDADTEELICTLEETSKDRYLIVRTATFDVDSLTTFIGLNYYGEFGFADLGNGKLTVVNTVDIEQYVMGVCAVEMSDGWPLEALKAQAVAARTFAQRSISGSVYNVNCGFDVTNDTYCQAYQGTRRVGDNIRAAVAETSNQYLAWNGSLIEALYSASDGGATEDAENVFGYRYEYLKGVYDPYEAAAEALNPNSSWTVTLTPKQLGERVGIGPICSVTEAKSRAGNVIELELVSTYGETVTLQRDRCRTALQLKSIHYHVTKDAGGNYVFSGGGYGHNVGMSQWGAFAMANYFLKDYRFILGYYYTDVDLCYGEVQ